jgi:hypothetical protein
MIALFAIIRVDDSTFCYHLQHWEFSQVPDGGSCRGTEELLNPLTQEQLTTLRAIFALDSPLALADCQDLVEALGGRVEQPRMSIWIFDFPNLDEQIIQIQSLFGHTNPKFIKDLRTKLRELGIDDNCL